MKKGVLFIDNIINSLIDYRKLNDYLEKFQEKHSEASVFSLGRSSLSREIWAIKIGNGKRIVLYAAAFHALEDLTANLMLKFADEITEIYEKGGNASGINISAAFEERSLVMVPLVNPDGIEIRRNGSSAAEQYESIIKNNSAVDFSLWNSNARGVDLNHNYDAGFNELCEILKEKGYDFPREKWYAGEYPESEPETKALCTFCRNNDVVSVYAFHSQGEEIYYTYGEDLPPKSALMAKILSGLSGYELSKPTGTAAAGGFKDWFIKEFSRPGFTFEVGKGENPLPLSMLQAIYKKLYGCLVYGIIL